MQLHFIHQSGIEVLPGGTRPTRERHVLSGGRLIVGALETPPRQALAPEAGPLFWLVVVHHQHLDRLVGHASIIAEGSSHRHWSDCPDHWDGETCRWDATSVMVLGKSR
jgi:hypothetical protein